MRFMSMANALALSLSPALHDIAHAALPEMKCNDNLTCLNGGKCETSVNANGDDVDVCYCSDLSSGRFVGVDCSIAAPVDPRVWCNIHGDFCLNGGECNEDLDSSPKVCVCKDGYTGKYCELEVDSSPIQEHVSNAGNNDTDIDDSDIAEACTLKCNNGGFCTFGYRDPTVSELTGDSTLTAANVTMNYQHCQCPSGTFGTKCENKVELCTRDSDQNPLHYCHNGGTCVDTIDYFDGKSNLPWFNTLDLPPYMCNCSTASEANGGKHYSGAYCEYTDVKFCNEEDPNMDARNFCANGGQCGRQGLGVNPVWICLCGEDFTGKHCEIPKSLTTSSTHPGLPTYPTTHNSPKATCDDDMCQNYGKCFHGVKDVSNTPLGEILKKPHQDMSHIMSTTSAQQKVHDFFNNKFAANENLQHCVCPSGFTGLYCENKFEVCPNGNHVCLHGSECVDDEAKCSCNEDGADTALAGKYCQHKATIKCGGKTYCFNGASCDGTACSCAEGWRGPNCQFSESVILEDKDLQTESKLTENYLDRMNPNLIVASGAIALFGIIFIIIVVAMTDHHREEYVSSSESAVPTIESGGRARPATSAFPPTPTNATTISKNDAVTSNSELDEEVAAAPAKSKEGAELI